MGSVHHDKTVVVAGGGAAGFFCAVNTARLAPLTRVIILERSGKLLSKVRISGGGRCNVTHSCFSIAEMLKRYPRGASFLKKAFHQFFTTDTIEWFTSRGVTLKTEADGRVFPSTDNSQTIIDCLMKEANRYGVEIMMNTEVLAFEKKADKISLTLSGERSLTADAFCIASGGYPKSTQFGWLMGSGHSIEDPVPSLFTFNMPGNPITALMGVVAEHVTVKIAGTRLMQEGPLLITHWGMSGPAILKLSAWGARVLAEKNYHFTAIINWIPEYNENTLREKFRELRFKLASQKIINRNPFGLPARLWEYLVLGSGVTEAMRWADLPAPIQNKLVKDLCTGVFEVKGKTTFKEEFVTAGGVDLKDIDHHTMESKIMPGLFFAGEVLDVDGVTGGFNFQHAWTSGWIAARSIAARLANEPDQTL